MAYRAWATLGKRIVLSRPQGRAPRFITQGYLTGSAAEKVRGLLGRGALPAREHGVVRRWSKGLSRVDPPSGETLVDASSIYAVKPHDCVGCTPGHEPRAPVVRCRIFTRVA